MAIVVVDVDPPAAAVNTGITGDDDDVDDVDAIVVDR